MGPNTHKTIVQFTRATEYKHKLHLEKEIKKKTWVVTFANKSEFAPIQKAYIISHILKAARIISRKSGLMPKSSPISPRAP